MSVSPTEELGGLPAQTAIQIANTYFGVTFTTATTSADDSFATALASLELIAQELEGLEILAAITNEDYDTDGSLVDSVHVTYRIIGRPGTFTVSVPFADNWNAIAFFYIGLQANTIELIYEGAASLAETPTQYLVPTPSDLPPILIPQPGHPIPV